MKEAKIEIVKKEKPYTLIDLGCPVNSDIKDLIKNQNFVSLYTGRLSKEAESLQSYIRVIIDENDIGKLEKCLTEYINNKKK